MKENRIYKVVFWGFGEIGEIGQTSSNLVALASYMAYFHGYQVMIRQTKESALDKCFSRYAILPVQKEEILLKIAHLKSNQDKMRFIDCGKHTDECARQLMRKADLVVVNLPQMEDAFDMFFLQYVRFSTKTLYLISNYHKDAYYNLKRIQQLYRIPTEQIAVVPFNPEFQLACERGILDHYMRKEVPFYVTETRRYFMLELEKAMERMMEQL